MKTPQIEIIMRGRAETKTGTLPCKYAYLPERSRPAQPLCLNGVLIRTGHMPNVRKIGTFVISLHVAHSQLRPLRFVMPFVSFAKKHAEIAH